jgi:PKD repeat protein
MIFLQKRMFTVLLTVTTMMTFAFIGNAQNMLTNPGFETWTGSKPDGWFGTKTNISASDVAQYTENTHSGSSACQLINTTTSHKRFTSQSLNVTAGTTYTVKFWARGKGDVRTGFWDGLGSDGANFAYNDYISVGSNDWKQYEQTVTAPATVNNAECIFSLRNTVEANGHLQIDDVELLGGGVAALKADFKADLTVAPVGSTIQFTDLSTGNPLQWEWTISGPETKTSTQKNPSFTFNVVGTYDVKLIVSDEETSDEATKTGYLTIGSFLIYQDWNTPDDWKGWTKVSITGTQEWKFTEQYGIDNTPCIQMSGAVGSTPVENEDWLISPEFQLTAGNKAVLNFWNAFKYDGNLLELYISNNYTGNVAAATWNKLSFKASTGEFVWTNSGDIALSAYSGNCHIAFKYTSTSEKSSSWELDNIMVQETNTAISTVEESKISVYPNPSTGIINIVTAEPAQVKVIAIDGRFIAEQQVQSTGFIDLSGFAKGNYLVQIILKDGRKITKKIILK